MAVPATSIPCRRGWRSQGARARASRGNVAPAPQLRAGGLLPFRSLTPGPSSFSSAKTARPAGSRASRMAAQLGAKPHFINLSFENNHRQALEQYPNWVNRFWIPESVKF